LNFFIAIFATKQNRIRFPESAISLDNEAADIVEDALSISKRVSELFILYPKY
jgi:hypothetical protein